MRIYRLVELIMELEDQFWIKISDDDAQKESGRSGRLSTTSPRTNKPKTLGELIDSLPPGAQRPHSRMQAGPRTGSTYERLEFLGDSVLELALALELYTRFPDYDEGQMAKIRSAVVSRASCAIVARELNLGDRLVAEATDPTEELTRLATNRNVLAAVLEAALAAIYLEHGFEPIAPAIVGAFNGRIEFALNNQVDHKTELQEQLARSGRSVNYAPS